MATKKATKAKVVKAKPDKIRLVYTRANGRRTVLSGIVTPAQAAQVEALIEALSFGSVFIVKRATKERAAKRAKPRVECKFCGTSLKGVSPIKPFSPIYDRMCPERDGDPCERVERKGAR